jgi:hypothetical protein
MLFSRILLFQVNRFGFFPYLRLDPMEELASHQKLFRKCRMLFVDLLQRLGLAFEIKATAVEQRILLELLL